MCYNLSHTNISIHAPTRGATRVLAPVNRSIEFQSTLPRGERPNGVTIEHGGLYISIHAPTRGATLSSQSVRESAHISIHAPTRGATIGSKFYEAFIGDFNPRSHEGSDSASFTFVFHHFLFQSTLPRGERHIWQDKKFKAANFNPRSHEGSDSSHMYNV